MFLSVNSLNILDVHFLYGTRLLHNWACYILFVQTSTTDIESVYLLLQYFFVLNTYHYKMCPVHGLNAATSHGVLLELRHVIRWLKLYCMSTLFLFDLKSDSAAGSCQPEINRMLVMLQDIYKSREHLE